MALVHRRHALTPAAAPAVSVCIANYNGRETLEAAIVSVLGQRAPFEVELIVHDDASPDHDLAPLQARYPQVEWLLGEANAGYCVSNNRMAAVARGTYLLLLNNDAVLEDDALSSLHARAREVGNAVLGLPQYDAGSGALLDRGLLLDPFLNPLPNLDPARREVAMVMGACLWIPRALWNELGGFPEWFGTLAEDLYLCCRARLEGHPVEVLPGSGFRHWVGRSLGGGKVVGAGLVTSRRRRVLSERNKTFAMLVLYPPAPRALLAPLHFMLLALEGLALSLVRRDFSLWRDIYWNVFRASWRERARLRAARAQVQARRKAVAAAFFRPHTWLPHKLTLLGRHGLPRVDG